MKKLLPLLLFLSLLSSPAQAGAYAQQCPKIYAFFIPAEKLTTELKGKLQKLCSCQEAELLKAGVSDQELKTFVRSADLKEIDPETAKIAPKINEIIQSDAVKAKCGSL